MSLNTIKNSRTSTKWTTWFFCQRQVNVEPQTVSNMDVISVTSPYVSEDPLWRWEWRPSWQCLTPANFWLTQKEAEHRLQSDGLLVQFTAQYDI